LHEQFVAARARLATLATTVAKLQRRKKFGTLDAGEHERLKTVEPELAAARTEFDVFVAQLPVRLAAQRASHGDSVSGESESHQKLLATLGDAGSGVASLQYVVTKDRVHVIATTATAQIARTISLSQSDLNSKVRSFREVLQNPRADPRPLGRELYAFLLAPIDDDLRRHGIHTVLLYLDGSLRYVPFAAFVDGDGYLVERFRLAIATDAARSRLTAETAAALAGRGMGCDAGVPGPEFRGLAGVREELNGIVRPDVLPGSAKLDDAFTLPALRASVSSPVLHIASHFRFVTGSEASFLLLGDGTHLTLRQMRKELPRFADVDLLTLSACETAMGSGTNESGLEVEGLGVLAQKHGAKAVLATLWPVADASTAVIMQEFYRNVGRAEQSKAEALRQAQLALLHGGKAGPNSNTAERAATRVPRETSQPVFAGDAKAPYAHPYYWAPLILMGNWL
jgi:CHAT domain-containing protein